MVKAPSKVPFTDVNLGKSKMHAARRPFKASFTKMKLVSKTYYLLHLTHIFFIIHIHCEILLLLPGLVKTTSLFSHCFCDDAFQGCK